MRLVSSYCNEESTTKIMHLSAMLCPVTLSECRPRGGTRSICSIWTRGSQWISAREVKLRKCGTYTSLTQPMVLKEWFWECGDFESVKIGWSLQGISRQYQPVRNVNISSSCQHAHMRRIKIDSISTIIFGRVNRFRRGSIHTVYDRLRCAQLPEIAA